MNIYSYLNMEENKMPAQDRTGPRGLGPMTGRGMGPCGNGMRRGFGRGFGCRWNYVQPAELTKEDEKKILEADLTELEAERKEIEKRLGELN
jgi:hypothetical protein